MPEYQIGDRVTLTAECGASTGTVCDWTGGPGPLGEYHLTADWHDQLEGATSAPPHQIATLLDPAPAFEEGQQIILSTRPGVIVEDWNDGRYLVEVEVQLTKLRGKSCLGAVSYIRRHLVFGWQRGPRTI